MATSQAPGILPTPSDLASRRICASIPVETLAAAIGLAPDTLREMEHGTLRGTAEYMLVWRAALDRLVADAEAGRAIAKAQRRALRDALVIVAAGLLALAVVFGKACAA